MTGANFSRTHASPCFPGFWPPSAPSRDRVVTYWLPTIGIFSKVDMGSMRSGSPPYAALLTTLARDQRALAESRGHGPRREPSMAETRNANVESLNDYMPKTRSSPRSRL
jgi:hypothetical protein